MIISWQPTLFLRYQLRYKWNFATPRGGSAQPCEYCERAHNKWLLYAVLRTAGTASLSLRRPKANRYAVCDCESVTVIIVNGG
jgi:hypothetical protein